ncbi:MAG: histidine kinase [Lewinellaceae bacterium]|nr:histidine kinase [Lewinellaceae bacterium]
MKRRIGLHLLFWLAFWFIYAYTYSRYDGNLVKYAITEGLQMPARILATYLSFWCFERFSGVGEQKMWLAFGGAATANILGGILNRALKMVLVVPVWFPDATFDFWGYRLVYDVFDCVLASCTALSARLYFRQQQLQQREAQLRAEKLDAELQALKSQIHPHFLFNTINNLYALARRKSDKTAPVALKLASLLRYILYESVKPAVRLEQEVQNLRDYVELEKLRFDEARLTVKMAVEMDNPLQQITPLLLLPLVENAFKHGVSEQREEARIDIRIELKNSTLEVNIRNTKSADPQENPQGIGLKNVRRQLELLYPGRHRLDITTEENTFSVDLRIDFA